MLYILGQTSHHVQYPSYDFNALKKRQIIKKSFVNNDDKQRSCKMWQALLVEILAVPKMSLEILAQDLEVSLDTLRRMSKGKTAYPHASLARGLFVNHMIYCPDRYGQQALNKQSLRELGWVSHLE